METNTKSKELKKLKLRETIHAICQHYSRITSKQEYEYCEHNTCYLLYEHLKNTPIEKIADLQGISFFLKDQHLIGSKRKEPINALYYAYETKKPIIAHLMRLCLLNTPLHKNINEELDNVINAMEIDINAKNTLLSRLNKEINNYTNNIIIPNKAIQYANAKPIKIKHITEQDVKIEHIDYLFKRITLESIEKEDNENLITINYKISNYHPHTYVIYEEKDTYIKENIVKIEPSNINEKEALYTLILLNKAGYYRIEPENIEDFKINNNTITIRTKIKEKSIPSSKINTFLMKSFIVKNHRKIILSLMKNNIQSALNRWYVSILNEHILYDTGVSKTDILKLYIANAYVNSNSDSPILDINHPITKNIQI